MKKLLTWNKLEKALFQKKKKITLGKIELFKIWTLKNCQFNHRD